MNKDNIRVYDKFFYHLEDIRCRDCLHYVKRRGCPHEKCLYEAEKAHATENGRIKLERGALKWDM